MRGLSALVVGCALALLTFGSTAAEDVGAAGPPPEVPLERTAQRLGLAVSRDAPITITSDELAVSNSASVVMHAGERVRLLPGLDIKRFPDITYVPIQFPTDGAAIGQEWSFKKTFGESDMLYSCRLMKVTDGIAKIAVQIEQEYELLEQRYSEVIGHLHRHGESDADQLADDIADMIVFLCSERASYVNGAFLNVDGAATVGL